MYAERRKKLLESLPIYSISVFMAGEAPYGVGDERYPFSVNRTFYYLTGLDKEKMMLMLVKVPNATREILFIEPFDPVMAKWVGGKMLPEEAKEISGINEVMFLEDFDRVINMILAMQGMSHPFTLCGVLSKQQFDQPWAISDLFNRIKNNYPECQVLNICEYTYKMRMVKDDYEIARMKKAINVTNAGIKAMMQAARPYIWENEAEAYFDFVLKSEQCEHVFHTICASG